MAYDVTTSHGWQIFVKNGGTYQLLNGVGDIDGPGRSPNIVEKRHHGINGTIRRVSGVTTEPVSFPIAYDSSDTQHLYLRDLANNGTKASFKMVATDQGAEIYWFDAIPSIKWAGPVDGFNDATVTLAVDGDLVYS